MRCWYDQEHDQLEGGHDTLARSFGKSGFAEPESGLFYFAPPQCGVCPSKVEEDVVR